MNCRLILPVLIMTCSIAGGCKKEIASSSPSAVSTGYVIRSKASGKCLNIPFSRKTNGVIIQQFDCNNTPAQLFQVVATDAGYIRIQSSLNDKVLEAQESGTTDGTPVQQWDSMNGMHQQFKVVEKAAGSYAILGRASGLALAVKDASQTSGATIELTKDSGADHELWVFEQGGKPIATLPSRTSFKDADPSRPPASSPTPTSAPDSGSSAEMQRP